MLAEFVWNPDRNLFIIPYLNHPVTWYGFLFALGFLIGFFLVRKFFYSFLLADNGEAAATSESVLLTDRLAILVGLGGILGARLGHVFFYEWPHYRAHPMDIFKIWEGGLASHGGAIGVLVALIIFTLMSRQIKPRLTFLTVLDAVVVPAALLGGFIRIGNFINQEIVGTPTTMPWGVIFLHPLGGKAGIPLHPVQLYESFFYFLVFGLLFFLWRRRKSDLGMGELSGWFFLLVFGFRFAVEYFKAPQNEEFDLSMWVKMGQLLSIPFFLLGLFLLFRRYGHARKKR